MDADWRRHARHALLLPPHLHNVTTPSDTRASRHGTVALTRIVRVAAQPRGVSNKKRRDEMRRDDWNHVTSTFFS